MSQPFIPTMQQVAEKCCTTLPKIQENSPIEPEEFSTGQSVDMVNKPPHYRQGGMETIKILKAKLTPEEFRGFCLGNIIKYVTRAPYKNGVEDYKKAEYYLKELIKEASK